MVEMLASEPPQGWLTRVAPEWTSAVALVRSVVLCSEDDISSMSVISEKCASSLFSFCVLVTLLRAQVHGDWGPALQVHTQQLPAADYLLLQMWSFVNPPRGPTSLTVQSTALQTQPFLSVCCYSGALTLVLLQGAALSVDCHQRHSGSFQKSR